MPWNATRSVTFADQKEILKFPVGLHAVKSVVLDGNRFPVNADKTRTVVPAGTILALGGSGANTGQYVAYGGASGSTGTIEGILAHDVDLTVQATEGTEPVPMFFFGCIFATEAIVGFTQYAAALVSALPSCKFE